MATVDTAVVNYGPKKYSVELREIPKATIGPDEVLLEVAGRQRLRQRSAHVGIDPQLADELSRRAGARIRRRDRGGRRARCAVGRRAIAW